MAAEEKKLYPTPLLKIKEQVLRLYEKYGKIADFLIEYNAPEDIRINKEDFLLQFYIDEQALNNITDMLKRSDAQKLIVLFGIQKYEELGKQREKLTACFLGMDKNQDVDETHRDGIVNGTFRTGDPGEESWPPPPYEPPLGTAKRPVNCLSLASNSKELENFFRNK